MVCAVPTTSAGWGRADWWARDSHDRRRCGEPPCWLVWSRAAPGWRWRRRRLGALGGGAACLAAGWFYSGGRRPYGYRGWGEVGVFVFFGFVAAAGSAYVQLEMLTLHSVWVGVGCGCLSCALLVANNLRDIRGDAVAGKRTLAVRMGAPRTRLLYAVLVVGGFAVLVPLAVGRTWALLGLAALPLAAGPLRRVLRGDEGVNLIGTLAATGRLLAAYGITVAAGLWIAAALA